MRTKTYVAVSLATGLTAFLCFRYMTAPIPLARSPLQPLLFAGYLLSAACSAIAGYAVVRLVKPHALRLLAVPTALLVFALCSGIGVDRHRQDCASSCFHGQYYS